MTTKVTVDAHAGWPVKVTKVNRPSGSHEPAVTVPANEKQDFYVHSGVDLLIHEVQPDEVKADESADDSEEESQEEE